MADQCPSCGAALAPDQRYCLNCGHRRGDPRLPFMDAVVFMDAAKQTQPAEAAAAPPSPPDRRPFMSANASLVAGVATLVLAIGVGVLIGRSGEGSSQTAAQPSVITVPAAGATAEASTGSKATKTKTANSAKSGNKPKSATVKKAKKKTEITQSGTTKATEEAYPVNPNVHLAEPEQELGGKCDPKAAGCNSNGEFEGNFFE